MPLRTPSRVPRGTPRRLVTPDRSADLSASAVVFLVALPLSLGIALTAGAPLQAGLVAAAVGGIVGGRLAGAPLQVSGPAAGLTVVTADLIHTYGWRTTCALTVVAGLAQLGLGRLRVARAALAVSPAITHGMIAGIGITIALAQLHVVLGGSPQSSAVANVAELPAQLASLRVPDVAVSALTVAVILGWPLLARPRSTVPRALSRMPAALAAVALATLAALAGGLELPRVDLPSWSSHALPEAPEGPLLGLVAAALTITLVSGVQSLLSAVAVDKLVAARGGDAAQVPRADLDKELRGLGVSNVVSGALGGLPVAGVAVRSAANVAAGAVSRNSAIWHGVWVALAAVLLAGVLEVIPMAALAALVMVVGVQMVSLVHLRSVTRHRELPVYVVTLAGVVLVGVLQGVGLGIAVAVATALHRLTHTRVMLEETDGVHRVVVRGQLTFLAVPRLSRALAQVPDGTRALVELRGSFMDHAAYESLKEWRTAHTARGGSVEVTGGRRHLHEPAGAHRCTPWTPWRNHQCTRPDPEPVTRHAGQLLSGVRNFQRTTAPYVREELARLAAEGQRPSQLFLTCSDSRLVTSMITSSGPGDLFTVRNVGNLVPPPGADGADGGNGAGGGTGDDSVAAAVEYAVEVLEVDAITVCGHSGCGAMQALLGSADGDPGDTPLGRWLRHGRPSLARPSPRVEGRAGDPLEELCLANVVQQLAHLRAHPAVARRVAAGRLELHGMYFHVAEAQAYVLETADPDSAGLFVRVGPGSVLTPSSAGGRGSAGDPADLSCSPRH